MSNVGQCLVNSERLALAVALTRAGAMERAWHEFLAAGLNGERDPACLTLAGRILKDRASSAASAAERATLYREAAAAYAAAAEAGGGTYPLINAATLYLLGANAAEAQRHAERVLARIQAEPDEPETPYWRVATQAEALLLLDRDGEGRAAFAEAIALAPLAWEDHASTLRQFGLILDAQGKNGAWLDAHRPPRSLHFGGHMSFDARVGRRAHLDGRIGEVLEEERVGFGFGALAAGADIIIAEALVDRGAELHAVLPGGPAAFSAMSVDPFGKGWRRRFDALLERAATVRSVRPLSIAPDRAMVELADEIAMGAAAMNSSRLESEALQLLVLADEDGAESQASGHHARWARAGWRQRILPAPREALPFGDTPALRAGPHTKLAVLFVPGGVPEGLEQRLAAIAEVLRREAAPAIGPYFNGDSVVMGYGDAVQAATAALAVAGSLGSEAARGVGGHYGAAHPVADPFGGCLRLGGDPAALAAAAAASAPAGTVCVTGDFAAALAAARRTDVRWELVGELESTGAEPVELYALKPRL